MTADAYVWVEYRDRFSSSRSSLLTPRGRFLRRITLTFRLSGHDVLRDLIHEFTLHHQVIASAVDDGGPTIAVETLDAPAALWDVRATVGMFDDHAKEVDAQ